MGAVAVAAAVAVPAMVPMLSQGMVGGFGAGSSGGRTIAADNPIADLKRDLERPDNIPILRYASDSERREYIRTATLDVFDGEQWSQSSRPLDLRVSDEFPVPPGLSWPVDELAMARYEFRISDNFSSPWLPLVYPARSAEIDGDWKVIPSTLEVFGEGQDVGGTTYAATSVVVDPDPAD